MSPLRRTLQALVILAIATIAHAEPLRLLLPASGSSLRGGSLAEVAWDAKAGPSAAEEWEAFLSVNGGAYYAFRITPHLDIELKRFTFLVPNVDTSEARIMIRTGDETNESHFEIPGSFAIVRDATVEVDAPRLPLAEGESAREGDPAVVAWTDGTRAGAGVTQESSTALPSSSVDWRHTVAEDSSPLDCSSGTWVAPPPGSATPFSARDKQKCRSLPLHNPVNLLLVCSRRNV